MADGTVRWGIIGPGSIANNYALGVAVAPNAELIAASGRDKGRLDTFADKYGIKEEHRHIGHAKLLKDAEVDAVYIASPHTEHAQMTIDALRAGKHVLCEKPCGLNAAEVRAMTDVAQECGLFFTEAYMYLFHPQIARLVEIVATGTIGEVESIESSFCFSEPFDPESRLYDPEVAGGAIMDIGGYPVSFARHVAGIPLGQRFADPIKIRGIARMTKSGVDGFSNALLEFPDGILAQCTASVEREMPSTATVHGRIGVAHLPMPWSPGKNEGPADSKIIINVGGKETIEEIKYPEMLYSLEAQRSSEAILAGKLEIDTPGMSWEDSVGNAAVLQHWRHETDYVLRHEKSSEGWKLNNVVKPRHETMPTVTIPGVDNAMSKLVMGCDYQELESDGNIIWDAWIEAGGNAFDTAWIYGMGSIEKLLGQWIDSRGVRDEVVVVVKGCHTPHCDPHSMRIQLEQSLERLNSERADIYLMHRDNPQIPVGEFVDQISELVDKGMIGVAGASNWTLKRYKIANEWASDNGKTQFSIISNNLSLAMMEKEPWAGCQSSNNPETLSYLRETNTAHLSWSAQARGYFIPEKQRSKLPKGTEPDTCFDSEANSKRRDRAGELAEQKGVSATNIATAWVLDQSFPSLALVGPRRPAEITSTLPALDVELTEKELAWLNLDSD